MNMVALHADRNLVKWKLWRLAQRLFLVLGILTLGYAAYTYAARYCYQAYESWHFDSSLTHHAFATQVPSPNAANRPSPPVALRSLLGRIIIPRLGISAMVKEGVDAKTLDLAVGHIPSTALPGRPGNVGMAAHRDNLFRNLKNVKRGDTITLTTLDNTYIYSVISFRVVNPTEVSVLATSGNENTLTLVTCYPFYFVGHAPKRFIVRARQVAAAAIPEEEVREKRTLTPIGRS